MHLRYETWVQYVSKRPMPRVDLEPLAVKLTGLESDGAIWKFDGVQKITPVLKLTNATKSTISADDFIKSAVKPCPLANAT